MFLQFLFTSVLLLLTSILELKADDDIFAVKSSDGTWSFVKPPHNVVLEIEYFTDEELADQASDDIKIVRQPRVGISRKHRTMGKRFVTVTAKVPQGNKLSYQWYVNTENTNTGGTLIEGATKRQYQIPDDSVDVGEVFYYCVLTNRSDQAVGSKVTEVVSSEPKVTNKQRSTKKRSTVGGPTDAKGKRYLAQRARITAGPLCSQ